MSRVSKMAMEASGGWPGSSGRDRCSTEEDGTTPIPATPTLAPSIVHALEASTDAEGVSLPPALQLIDLQDGTYRSLPLLPAAAERADESSDSAGRGSIGRRFGFGGGGRRSIRVQWRWLDLPQCRRRAVGCSACIAMASSCSGRRITALAKGVDEWKRIAGYKDGGDGEGGGGGLSIVRDFESASLQACPSVARLTRRARRTWAATHGRWHWRA